MNKFCLTLDDFSPHPKAGLKFEVIEICNKIIEKHPEFKVNLFVPAAYCRLGEEPCFLSNAPDWINMVKSLPDNYRINYHGYYHRRISKSHGNSNNDEWQYLNRADATKLIDDMMNMFYRVGLKVHKTFRPPGWKISKDATQVLTERGFMVAGNKAYYDLYKKKIPGLRWKNYNWDMTGPCSEEGNVCAFGHTSSWTNNYMNEDRMNLILELLGKREFEFKFVEEM